MKKHSIQRLVHIALLIALEIILSRFLSIATPVVKIGFAFIPLALCGILYGPLAAGMAAALADLLGAILFPIGAYFPGFTLTAFLTGCVFGHFLYQERSRKWGNVGLAVAVNCLVLSLLLNTFWISALYGTPYLALLPTRVLQCVLLIPVQACVLRLMGTRQLWALVDPKRSTTA